MTVGRREGVSVQEVPGALAGTTRGGRGPGKWGSGSVVGCGKKWRVFFALEATMCTSNFLGERPACSVGKHWFQNYPVP